MRTRAIDILKVQISPTNLFKIKYKRKILIASDFEKEKQIIQFLRNYYFDMILMIQIRL